ncbi:MAG: 2,6-beta-D-fructofuranosidase [Bacteroidota bacterium]
MNKIKTCLVFSVILLACSCNPSSQTNDKSATRDLSITVSKKYLNLPVSHLENREKMSFEVDGKPLREFVIRLAPAKPDYWVFHDVTAYIGKTVKISYTGNPNGLKNIYQDDKIAGQDSLYKEFNRPQVHFTSRRGWNNDPNGLVYYEGEYHLFYQHNPYEIQWENMHWGHAVSKDLLHWEELGIALFPDTLGTMFSGSAVIDKNNTAGWGENAMIAFYTAAGKRMTQNVAYSTDRGRSFTKYEGNPLLGADRDPKVFWYEPSQNWVMVLYDDNFNAIYNSKDLKKWELKSKTSGFYECPELFELSVDGDINNKKWVMYGGSGTYMIGSFNGEKFSPENGKYFYSWGSQYAAQTYNNTPDGKRIQIGWGRIEHPGMPFNQMMLFPDELTLRTTPEGVRLYCEPIKEIENLHDKTYVWKDITSDEVNEKLKTVKGNILHAKMDVEIIHGLGLEVRFKGNPVINFDGNFNRFNGAPYICDKPDSFRFIIELIIDKTSVEAYIGNGKLFISEGLKQKISEEGLSIMGNVKIHSLEVNELKSIW